VDVVIGRLRSELQRLGVSENTVVIFMSDNGMFFGERGLSDCWLLYEDSLRVPMIISDPRQSDKRHGITANQIVLNIDISPTILDLAGLDALPMIQGRSLIPLMEGKSPVWRTDFFCEHLFTHAKIPKSEGVRTERWKYIRYFEQQPVYEELFDLTSVPQETHNLAGDPQHTDQLELLRQRCDELLAEARGGL
jgi:arylsulfatase A-like enzyme